MLLSKIKHISFASLVTCCLALFSVSSVAEQDRSSEPKAIVYAGFENNQDYTLQLLALALHAAGNQYAPRPLGYFPPRGRDFTMMEKQQGIDIMWGSARHDRERRFLPIRIPIFKGLIGWRVPLVTEKNINIFQGVNELASLRELRPGQHFRWTDTTILKDNGINVFEVNNRTSLMDMLISEKFDYFPRAVIEIQNEYEQNKARGVVIDPHVLIVYPTAFYFYVHQQNVALAEDIKAGLESLIASGEMDELFNDHFGEVIRSLSISRRQIFELSNKHIPPKAPFSRKELWLDPHRLPPALQSTE